MSRSAPPRDFKSWQWSDGLIRPAKTGVPLSDRGFRYGQHVFESVAVRGGVCLLAGDHLRLLGIAARHHRIPFPRVMLNAVRDFLDSVSLQDGMLRIYLTAGRGAPAAPAMRPGCYLAWEKTRFPTEAEIGRGISLAQVENTIAGREWGQKCGNYAAHVSAMEEARESGCEEGIIFDSAGRVVSCAMGNLIVWLRTRRGILCCTPPVERGARTGAVLHWVRRHLGQGGLVERDLRRADLERAISLAVTNSRLGVMPVSMVSGRIPTEPLLACKLAQEYLSQHDLLRTA